MKVTKTLIPTTKTQSQIDDMMNNLMLDLQGFSKIACLDGRAFGVRIYNEQCESFKLNECIRSRMIQGLASAQATAEDLLGYPITPRYQTIDLYPKHWLGNYEVDRGVESVNVTQNAASVDGFGAQTINYYTTSAVVADNGSNLYIDVDRDLVWNVDDIIIRDASNDRVMIDTTIDIEISGSDWRIYLDDPYITGSAYVGNTLYIQDSQFMMVQITPPVLANSGTLYPVYPDTNQIIPCAREVESVAGGDERYWFHPWVLVDDRRFSDDQIDLQAGEFYKLLQEIEFKEFYESTVNPTVTYLDTDLEYQSASSDKVLVDIVDASKGIISVDLSNWYENDKPSKFAQVVKVTLSYKTNPTLLGFNDEENTVSIAIANLVAAELPLEVCKCQIDKGFIAQAQQSYGEIRINPMTAEEKQNIRYGDKVGQKVFYDYIDRVFKKKRRIRI